MRKMILCVLGFVGAASSIRAQSFEEAVAATALQLTPVAALPPFVTSTVQGEAQHGVALGLRYGYYSRTRVSANNGGVSAIIPFGSGATVTLTGGFFDYSCNECDPGLMLSVGADRRLGDMMLGSGRDGARLQFALNGEIGYGQPSGATLSEGSVMSGAVGIPISLISGSRVRDEMRIVPFITPGFGFGGIRGNGSTSGSALMIGGGLGIYNRTSSVAFSVGFQHIAVSDAGTQVGLALVLGGR